MCVSACPYKKIYYNWKSGKAEKCIFCYPRIEAGLPTVCSETCVGRIRYLGVILYDADRIEEIASTEDEQDLYEKQLEIFLDPNDPAVIAQARADGIEDNWIEAAKISPIWKMAMEWKIAFPLHPEYRTLPMVWYVPPLSPIQNAAERNHIGFDGEIPDIASLRVPVKYLANLLTAGKEEPVVEALRKMFAMRIHMVSFSDDRKSPLKPGLLLSLSQPPSMPFLPPDLLDRLNAEIADRGCAMAGSAGHLHPVCALWRSSALDRSDAYVESGRRSLKGFAESLGFAEVEWSAGPDPFFNINSPADLAEAERRLAA